MRGGFVRCYDIFIDIDNDLIDLKEKHIFVEYPLIISNWIINPVDIGYAGVMGELIMLWLQQYTLTYIMMIWMALV